MKRTKDRLIIIGNIEPNEDDMFMNLIFQKKNYWDD